MHLGQVGTMSSPTTIRNQLDAASAEFCAWPPRYLDHGDHFSLAVRIKFPQGLFMQGMVVTSANIAMTKAGTGTSRTFLNRGQVDIPLARVVRTEDVLSSEPDGARVDYLDFVFKDIPITAPPPGEEFRVQFRIELSVKHESRSFDLETEDISVCDPDQAEIQRHRKRTEQQLGKLPLPSIEKSTTKRTWAAGGSSFATMHSDQHRDIFSTSYIKKYDEEPLPPDAKVYWWHRFSYQYFEVWPPLQSMPTWM